jgi:hypothetical protein
MFFKDWLDKKWSNKFGSKVLFEAIAKELICKIKLLEMENYC